MLTHTHMHTHTHTHTHRVPCAYKPQEVWKFQRFNLTRHDYLLTMRHIYTKAGIFGYKPQRFEY